MGRRLYRSGIDLTVEAALRAIDDAGLTAADIDGVSTYPGFGGSFGGAMGAELHEALRLSLNWRNSGVETSGPLGAVHNAVLAVAAGLARHVLVFRTVTEGSGGPLRPGGGRGGGRDDRADRNRRLRAAMIRGMTTRSGQLRGMGVMT